MSKGLVWSAAAMLLALATSSADAQWGSIKGKVVVDGDFATLKPLVVKGNAAAKDAAVCAAADVPDESAVVDPATKGVANVVIYLRKKTDMVHPKFEKPAAATVVYDQMGCKFIPHVAIVQTNQQLNVISGDAVAHNTRAAPIKNQGFNFIIAPNDREGIKVPFKLTENLPIGIGCDIHPWMKGWVLVVDHPYAAITKADGTFEITDLPPGELEFRGWQEKIGYVAPAAGDKSFKVKVVADKATEVPTIKIRAADLLK
jgi:hypothetical protein